MHSCAFKCTRMHSSPNRLHPYASACIRMDSYAFVCIRMHSYSTHRFDAPCIAFVSYRLSPLSFLARRPSPRPRLLGRHRHSSNQRVCSVLVQASHSLHTRAVVRSTKRDRPLLQWFRVIVRTYLPQPNRPRCRNPSRRRSTRRCWAPSPLRRRRPASAPPRTS